MGQLNNMKVLVAEVKSDVLALAMEPSTMWDISPAKWGGHQQKSYLRGVGDRIRGDFPKHKKESYEHHKQAVNDSTVIFFQVELAEFITSFIHAGHHIPVG